MAWIYLGIAGLFEIGWPLGLRLAQGDRWQYAGIAFAVGCMAVSGFFLYMAQKTIPMGTAYAVWTGIGAAGTFLVGVVFLNEPALLWRFAGVAMIIGGVATLKMAG